MDMKNQLRQAVVVFATGESVEVTSYLTPAGMHVEFDCRAVAKAEAVAKLDDYLFALRDCGRIHSYAIVTP